MDRQEDDDIELGTRNMEVGKNSKEKFQLNVLTSLEIRNSLFPARYSFVFIKEFSKK